MKFEPKKGWNIRAYTIATLILSVVVCLFVVGNLVVNLNVNVETTDTEEKEGPADQQFDFTVIERGFGKSSIYIVYDSYTKQSYLFMHGYGAVWLRPAKEELYR